MAEEKERISRLERRRREADKRQADQLRMVRLVAGGIIGLIVIILGVAVVLEYFIVPQQAVAQLDSGTEITIGEFQDTVRFQRAQLIALLDQQLELFTDEEAEDPEAAEIDAIRLIQQFSGQQINFLLDADALGEVIYERMLEDAVVLEEAERRGIEVTEAEVDEILGADYGFYDTETGLPTPFPTATTGPEPTPSITPIAIGAEEAPEEVAEPTATLEPLPSPTPRPTNTPVSRESFEESLQEDIDAIGALGADTDIFREQITIQIYRDKLSEALFAESDTETVVPHVSAYFLIFATEQSANEQAAIINDNSYLEVWNTIRSLPEGFELAEPAEATERLFLTEAQYEQIFPAIVVEELMNLEVGETSGVIAGTNMQTGAEAFFIVSVSGIEDRELNEATVDQLERENFNLWLEGAVLEQVTRFENWRGRIPRTPALDSKYLLPPDTPTPPSAEGPVLPTPAP